KKVEEYAKAEVDELTADVRSWFEKLKAEIGALAHTFEETDKAFYDRLIATVGIVADYVMHKDEATFTPLIKTLVSDLIGFLTPDPTFKVSLGNIGVDPDKPLGVAVGLAVNAAELGWLVSYFSKDAGETLAKFGELFAGAIGYEELKDVLIGPLI